MGNFYTTEREIDDDNTPNTYNTPNIKLNPDGSDPTYDYMKNVPATRIGHSWVNSCDFCIEAYDTNEIIYKENCTNKSRSIGWIVCEKCKCKPQALEAMKGYYPVPTDDPPQH